MRTFVLIRLAAADHRSIVQQIVTSLGGHIDVTSELGNGTHIRVMTPIGDMTRQLEADSVITPSWKSKSDPEGRMTGKILCLYAIDDPPSTCSGVMHNNTKRILAIRSWLIKVAEEWLGMSVISTNDANTAADVYFVNDLEGLRAISLNRKPVLALLDEPTTGRELEPILRNRVTHIRHPLTPRKLATSLRGALRPKSFRLGWESGLPAKRTLERERDHQSTEAKADLPAERKGVSADDKTPTASPGRQTRRPNVLLVDDNPINLKVLVMCVAKMGCTYTKAANGLEALNAYKASAIPYDMVFMDLSMPVMDGITATREIRAFEDRRKTTRTRIAALTGLGSQDAEKEAYSSGVDLFLTKPVSIAEVRGLLQQHDGDS